jgi:hypothetical protein
VAGEIRRQAVHDAKHADIRDSYRHRGRCETHGDRSGDAELYAAHYQVPLIFSSLARVAGPPMSANNDVKKAIWSVDKDQPVWAVRSLEAQVDATQGQSRFLRCCSASSRASRCCSRALESTA